MERYDITDTHRQKAQKLYDFKALNKSIMRGGCNIIGALGEVMIQDIFVHQDTASTYDYDLIIDNDRIDVKTVKVTNKPNKFFNAKIPAYQKFQKTDYYFFGYVTADLKEYYLAGYIAKEQFFNLAELKRAGDTESNFTFRCDTYILKAGRLKEFY